MQSHPSSSTSTVHVYQLLCFLEPALNGYPEEEFWMEGLSEGEGRRWLALNDRPSPRRQAML